VTNDGEVPMSFSWQYEAPFTLQPVSGQIAPGSAAKITAAFKPTEASVFVANCVCTVPGHTTHVIKLGGIGKYPFVAASAEKIDHGQVLTGQRSTTEFKLRNSSLVYARFKIVRTESDVEPVFSFEPKSGIIPPDGELTIAVLYAPKVTGTFSSDHYEVRTPGGNTVPLEVVGEAVGPTITLSKDIVNFGDVSIELPAKKSSRILESAQPRRRPRAPSAACTPCRSPCFAHLCAHSPSHCLHAHPHLHPHPHPLPPTSPLAFVPAPPSSHQLVRDPRAVRALRRRDERSL
jgi:hypothetical protein